MPPVIAHFAHLAQIAVAALGGFAFHLLGVPAAWLSGSMVAVVLWGSLGLARKMPKALTDAAMLVSGAIMGASLTPEAIAAAGRYPSSLVVLFFSVVAISGASMLWLTRVSGWRKVDAVLASVPGALTTVLAVAVDRKAAVASVAIVQSVRLFVLMTLLPSLVVLAGAGDHDGTILLGQGQPMASPLGLALMLGAGLGVGAIFERVGVAAPMLLGATLASTLLHATEIAPGAVPPVIAMVGFVLIGIFIAERFRTLRWISLRHEIPAALGSFAISMVIATLFAGLAASLARVSFADALVAFAPGGVEAMMVLALVLGLDPLYVGIHHVARFVGIGFLVPFVVSWMQRGK